MSTYTPDTTPVWLLDIDGVLNSNAKNGWHEAPLRRYAYTKGYEYKIRWSPTLLDRIRAIIRDRRADVRWATSWVGETAQFEKMMGLPALPDAFTLNPDLSTGPPIKDASTAAKRAAALDVVRSGRRLLWTDDDAIWPDGPERDELLAAGALLIAPDERRGLSPAHMDAIDAWLNSNPEVV